MVFGADVLAYIVLIALAFVGLYFTVRLAVRHGLADYAKDAARRDGRR